MVRVGMIGCGGMGTHHGPVLAGLSNVRVVATCDVIESKARSLAEKIGIDRWCTDFHDLLDDVDAVWVCTEPFNRVEVVTTCAGAGKHVFTEKPICNTLEGADAMIAAAVKAGVKYMLGYCLRFWQPYRILHDTFASGRLGGLVSTWMRRFMPWDERSRWYGQQEKSGGAMLDFGSHDVDWLRWIGGDVKTVFGRTFRVREGAAADEHGAALFVFGNGGIATVEDSWSSHLSESTFGIVGTEGSMFVSPDKKVRRKIGWEGQEETVDVQAALAVDPTGRLGEADGSGGIRAVTSRNESIQEHFFRCIEEDIEPLTPATEGRKTLATIAALWESQRTGMAAEVQGVGR
jgi:UDP-N-acetylglucosamine 3-dehydrogenase